MTLPPPNRLSPQKAPSEADERREAVYERLRVLDERIDTLWARGEDPVGDTAATLSELQNELYLIARQVRTLEPDQAFAPGPELLQDLANWRRHCEETGCHEPVALLHELAGQVLAEQARAWDSAVADAPRSLDERFDELRGTTTLLLTAIEEGVVATDAARRLTHTRDRLHRAIAQQVAASKPPVDDREHYLADLLDQCDNALTDVEELPSGVAERKLSVAVDEAAWHLSVPGLRGPASRALSRSLRRLRAERQERQLRARLEDRFGARRVIRFERMILILIVAVVGILTFEWVVDVKEPRSRFMLDLIDTGICTVFLWDFGVRMYYVTGKWRYFRRHFLFDLLPSIPFGAIALLPTTDVGRTGRLARYLRLPQLARSLRLLRPVIRVLRAIGFLFRGIDHLARRMSPLLNRNVILYPNREERLLAGAREESLTLWTRRLRANLRHCWGHTLHSTRDAAERQRLAERRQAVLGELLDELAKDEVMPHRVNWRATHDLPADVLIERLATITPEELELELGPDLVARTSRMVRSFCSRPLCWLPVIHSLAPPIDPRMSDSELLVLAAQHAAAVLKKSHDRWFFMADLHGTVTPSQFIDRCGTMLVRSSFRPAYRLALFGGVFMLIDLFLRLFDLPSLAPVHTFLFNFVRPTVILLGGVCLAVFTLGWWLRRIAREATEFYERAAQAQFLALTEVIRSRYISRDTQLLYNRILRPEWLLREPDSASHSAQHLHALGRRIELALLGSNCCEDPYAFDWLERVVLLHRDSLDGALYADNDTRTTSQLLGNPAIRQLLALSHRFGSREAKALQALDLERQKSMFGGPYLWFTLTSRAIAHSVAALLVDYNRHAIPLNELPLSSGRDLARYKSWLAAEPRTRMGNGAARDTTSYVTTAFTVLHFLDFDPQRDAEVALRFGPQVLERLARDRSNMIRRIFGTYPSHLLPRERRVLNLYSLYERWLAGGRALIAPVVVVASLTHSAWQLLRSIALAVREVMRPDLGASRADDFDADFATAARKIDRIRGPVVYASLRIRSRFDPEYLGATLATGGTADLSHDLEADIRFLNPDPWTVIDLRGQQRRARSDMARLDKLIREGLLDRVAQRAGLPSDAFQTSEHRRALAVAYLADFHGVRPLLSSRELLDEVFGSATLVQLPPKRPRPRPFLWRLFRRYWHELGRPDDQAMNAAWQATLHNYWGVGEALQAWAKLGDRARSVGEELLSDLLRHPGRISEQLVTLRTIQTLAVLDQLNYRSHLFELGRYAELGDIPGDRLTWGV